MLRQSGNLNLPPQAPSPPRTGIKTPTPSLPPPPGFVSLPNDAIKSQSDTLFPLLQSALSLERAFISTLRALSEDFRAPLRHSPPVDVSAEEIEALFVGIDELLAAAPKLLSTLEGIVASKKPFVWLAPLYAKSPAYLEAYRGFLATHEASMNRISATRARSPEFVSALLDLQKMRSSHVYPLHTLEDLLWSVCSRVKHIVQISRIQRNLVSEVENINKIVNIVSQFAIDGSDKEKAIGSSPSNSIISNEVEASFEKLNELDILASKYDGLYSALDVEKSIECPIPGKIPHLSTRKFNQKLPALLVDGNEFGFAAELPVWLLLFNDGIAVTTSVPQGTGSAVSSPRMKYKLLEWYRLSGLQSAPVETHSSKRHLFKVTSRKLQEDIIAEGLSLPPLPPGWEESEAGRGKKVWVFKPSLGGNNNSNSSNAIISSQFPPRTDLMCKTIRTFSFSQDDSRTWSEWTRIFRDESNSLSSSSSNTSNNCANMYQIVGTCIENLMRLEQVLYPGNKVPLIVRKIICHVLAHGCGEEGIFRLGAEQRVVDELKTAVNSGKLTELRFDTLNIHLISNLLKLYLRELPAPLITPELYQKFHEVLTFNEDKQIETLKGLIGKLPDINAAILRELIQFLYFISKNSESNHMTPNNLAIVVAPSLLWQPSTRGTNVMVQQKSESITEISRSNDVATILVAHFPEIFGEPGISGGIPRKIVVDPENPFVTLRSKLVSHRKQIRSMSISNNDARETLLWTIDGDGWLCCWDTKKRVLRRKFATTVKSPLCSLHIDHFLWISSPQSGGILVFDTDEAEIAPPNTNDPGTPLKPIATISSPNVFSMCLISIPNGDDEIWCGCEGTIRIYSPVTLEQISEMQDSGVSISCITTVKDSNNRNVVKTVWTTGYKRSLSDQEIHIWDPISHSIIQSFCAHQRKITALISTPNNEQVWSGMEDGTISVWNSNSLDRLAKLERHTNAISCFVILSDQVWSCSWDKTIVIWSLSLRLMGEVKGFHTDTVISAIPINNNSNNNNNTEIWTASLDKSICCWEVTKIPQVLLTAMSAHL